MSSYCREHVDSLLCRFLRRNMLSMAILSSMFSETAKRLRRVGLADSTEILWGPSPSFVGCNTANHIFKDKEWCTFHSHLLDGVTYTASSAPNTSGWKRINASGAFMFD
ncbi:hypothetical protein PHYBLDRAFT_153667 [Phycomyces blakesleeanus NRRL 1555(-)]|nr:hypothetical protein PHYBLDRAFT_153667 [Phycomyces blakesleeanus NRRL 1555(-)]OAD65275.1 hypothetical protein PHYBLDRAFT_153667 [Phycomyces blakesleeanus NRRL 1555(-)]|eukprot:XP_018283315.1 hypothetical protein PHYBLDRAFT_153667 [Phycomyces blakesleeanus NRRL 1555(-)]